MEEKYQKIKEVAEKELVGADAGHDINHVMRVYHWALKLIKSENNIDLDVLIVAVLLHDIAHVKEKKDRLGKICHARVSAKMAQKILKKFEYPQNKIDKIVHCILAHRYRTTGVEPKTKEAKILFDADKLDCLGAVGVARSYIWVGRNNAKIYTEVPLEKYIKDNLTGGKRMGRIKNKTKHSPILEYKTKLKYIPDKLYTQKAKKIAKERLKYMELFFDRLKEEIKGQK